MGFKLVGTTGFEPVTTTPPVWCATRLRYAPNQRGAIVLDSVRIEMVLAFSSWAGKVRSRKVDESGLNVGFLVSMGTCGLVERTRFG